MVDQVKIYCKGGNGSDGCRSFYRDKWTRVSKFSRGIPDGGDGGNGGDCLLRVDKTMLELSSLRFKQHVYAESGHQGSSKKAKGADGKNSIIRVPQGTLVYDLENNLLLRDLKEDGQEIIIVKGGKGGHGNSHRRDRTLGEAGQSRLILLELKLIADVGIIGLPNAGKSTLICAISGAHSMIADYPFTTKSPVLGIVERDDFKFTVADIPGLIEGSHKGKGLGDKFLRHVERTKVLVHMIDMSGAFGQDPVADYNILNKELSLYSKELADKDRVLVANKMDLDEAAGNLKRFKKDVKGKIYPVSALKKAGLEELIEGITKKL